MISIATTLLAFVLGGSVGQPVTPVFVADSQIPRADLVVTHEGRGYVIDRSDGRVTLEVPLERGEEAVGSVDGLLVVRGDGLVRGIGVSGKSWARQTREVRPPLLVGGALLLRQHPGELVAIQPKTGEILWSRPLDVSVVRFLWAPGRLFLIAGEDLQSVDHASGKTSWTTKKPCSGQVVSVSVEGRTLSVLCRGEVLQIDSMDGRMLSRRALPVADLSGVGWGDVGYLIAQDSQTEGSRLQLLKPNGELLSGPACFGSWTSGTADGTWIVARCDLGTEPPINRDCLLLGLRADPELSVSWVRKATECGRVLPGTGGAVVLHRRRTLESVDAATGQVRWERRL